MHRINTKKSLLTLLVIFFLFAIFGKIRKKNLEKFTREMKAQRLRYEKKNEKKIQEN